MTGAQFEAEGHRLALAYAALRPNGPAWLAAWLRDDPSAADELMVWELLDPASWPDPTVTIPAESLTP